MASQKRWNLRRLLKGLEGDCQGKEERRVDQVQGAAREKAWRCEADGAPGRVAGSSFS